MKKNISINISGIIFHIEEDGYDNLKKYLDSINRYFSTFDDSSEILADIEGRIAEIFLLKLNEEKQVITSDDVNGLITTMGSVSDFRAAEDISQDDTTDRSTGGREDERRAGESKAYAPSKRLFRDQKRKILGGVCAGLGNYYNMDPLWFRLLFAALLFAAGFTVVVYILMWIIVPGSYTLDESDAGKKMFRDPQTRIIGGVSGGIAAYFGIDTVLVRVLFIALCFAGGLGFFLYVILWICLPEARSLTDKMQMQGEPLTLSNIESNIKKNLNTGEGEPENTFITLLLLPFRIIGGVLNALGAFIRPLADIARVLIGVVFVLTGVALLVAVVATGGMLLGLFAGTTWFPELHDLGIPMDVIIRAFPASVAWAASVALLIPGIFIILLGASVVAGRLVFNGTAGWALFALFLISIGVLAVGIPRIVYAFHEEGSHRVTRHYSISGKSAALKLSDHRANYQVIELSLRGHNGGDFRLEQRFEAQGSSYDQAVENAKMVDYTVAFEDSVLTFDRELRFREDAIFRAQRLNMVLYIPYDFPFTMDDGIARLISQHVDREYLHDYTWKITRDGLECIDCGVEDSETNRDDEHDDGLVHILRLNQHP